MHNNSNNNAETTPSLWTTPWSHRHQKPVREYEDSPDEEEKGLLRQDVILKDSSSLRTKALPIICIILLAIIIVQNVALILQGGDSDRRPSTYSKVGLPTIRDQIRLAGVPSVYWAFDVLNRSTEAWEAILPGHGVVALSPEFVAAHGLPETIDHPEDPTKKVYAIESYHMIHCVQWLRRGYVALKQGGTDDDHALEHVLHCFDALRQSIMCQANDELLTITGHGHERGYNQSRQCRSWDALRDFATENPGCYRDYDPPEGESRWNQCDNGVDGLPFGNLW